MLARRPGFTGCGGLDGLRSLARSCNLAAIGIRVNDGANVCVASVFAQRCEVDRGVGVSALRRPCKRVFGFIESVRPGKQHREGERRLGIAGIVGATICRGGAREIAAILEEDAEVVCGVGVPALVRACKRLLGIGQPVRLDQQHGEGERAVSVAALVGPVVRLRGAGNVTSVFEEDAQVVCGVRVTAPVGACKRLLGFGQLVRAGQKHRERKRAVGVAALVSAMVRGGSTGDIAALFEQHAQLGCGGRVAALVGAPICSLSAIEVAAVFE